MAMKTASIDRANALANKALGGFERARTQLQKSNDMLEQVAEEQRLAREEWQRQVEEAIKAAEEAEQAAVAYRAKNDRALAVLDSILG